MSEAVRPRTKPREARNEDILNAALELFSRDGFSATRIDDVAERAGISKGTVYLYFKSKEELFEAVVRRFIEPHIENMGTISEQTDLNAEELLRRQVRILYKQIAATNLREILRMLMAEGERFPHLIDYYFDNVISRGFVAIAAVIARGVKEGEFRNIHVEQYPQTIVGPVIMAGIWKSLLERRKELDVDSLYETHIDLLLRGLRIKG